MTNPRLIEVHGKPVSGGAHPLICTPLVGRTRDAVLAELAVVQPKSPDLIEWRVDYFEGIGDGKLVIETARAIKARAGSIPIIFTRRSAGEGGEKIPIGEDAVVALYGEVCAARCVDIIDYEMSNAPEHFTRLRSASRENDIPLIASYHNFKSTPDRAALIAKFTEARRLQGDIAKVAVMPAGPEDVLTLLGATYAATQSLDIPLISMSMGGYGSLSRMIGWVYGSTVTFAVGKSSSAPGQIPIEELQAVLAASRRAVTGH
ncbi:MAG TPA: type I 3-dehydroquinate dehydratase [Casimicrobiaceae bacterium]|nr:type I 3-dehydroquinate dehydratase [Casimicrobiaceae bacterium]